jgi:hypothetical protein
MIANFFNQTRPINFLVLSVLVFVIFVVALFHINSEELSFYFFLRNGSFLSVAILIIFVLNFIIRKNSLTEDNSYAILFYILISSFFPQTFSNGGIFVANFILLFAFRKIYSLRTTTKTKEKIFDAAFWIGIASLFYIWSLIFMILLYAAILVFRKADWRNLLIPLFGLITPVFLSYTYLLYFDDLEHFKRIWLIDYAFDLSVYNNVKFLIPLISMGILVVISIIPTTNKSLIAKIDVKSTWFLLIAHFFVSLLLVLLAPSKNGSELTFLFFPVSILFANYLQLLNRYWIKETILYLFIFIFFVVYL